MKSLAPFKRLLVPPFLLTFFALSGFSSDHISLSIEKTENSLQGRYDSVSVFVSDGFKEIDGFDILMAYDSDHLTFLGAHRGLKLYGADYYHWEYFQYYFGEFGECGAICPSGKLRVVGIADVINGANYPAGYGAIKGDELFTLIFQISQDRTLECQVLPIRFCWFDCGDNTLSAHLWDTLFVSGAVTDVDGVDITDPNDSSGYPTYKGVQDIDCDFGNYKKPVIRDIDFYNGGIQISCPETLDARGDVNRNDIAYEVADAIVLSNYFVYGMRVLPDDVPYPLSATDINGDGIPLTLADLVYFVRLIWGGAPSSPILDTVQVDYVFEDDVVSVRSAIGAAYFQAAGNVKPTNDSPMEMRYAYDAAEDLTRILVYSFDTDEEINGDFIRIPGEIIHVEMATYDGGAVRAHQVHIPDRFVLLPNFPNPFNSSTVISFGLPVRSEYRLQIYNLNGQLIGARDGTAEAGSVALTWDASDCASGVYFYRLQVGDYSETRKMVLLK